MFVPRDSGGTVVKVLFVLLLSSVVCAGEFRASTEIVTVYDWSGNKNAEHLAAWSTRFALRVAADWGDQCDVQPFLIERIALNERMAKFSPHDRRIVIAAPDCDLLPILRHEITHAVLSSYDPDLPRWADEGIASQYDADWLVDDRQNAMDQIQQPSWDVLSTWTQMGSLCSYGWAAEIIAFLKTKMTGPEVIDSILSGKFLNYEQDWLNERRSH